MAMRILALTAAFMALAPQARAVACHCARDAALHRPSTPAEHAQTERLNREFRAASQTPVVAPVAPPGPPARAAENTPPPAPHGSQLEQYLELRRAYDRQLWAYYRAFPSRGQTYAYAKPQPAPAPAVSENEIGLQDKNRLAPWHGYNPHDGLSNGY